MTDELIDTTTYGHNMNIEEKKTWISYILDGLLPKRTKTKGLISVPVFQIKNKVTFRRLGYLLFLVLIIDLIGFIVMGLNFRTCEGYLLMFNVINFAVLIALLMGIAELVCPDFLIDMNFLGNVFALYIYCAAQVAMLVWAIIMFYDGSLWRSYDPSLQKTIYSSSECYSNKTCKSPIDTSDLVWTSITEGMLMKIDMLEVTPKLLSDSRFVLEKNEPCVLFSSCGYDNFEYTVFSFVMQVIQGFIVWILFLVLLYTCWLFVQHIKLLYRYNNDK